MNARARFSAQSLYDGFEGICQVDFETVVILLQKPQNNQRTRLVVNTPDKSAYNPQ
tara:strand:+ start:324 stop:491 length:168 start_codon:yes stop_codon:yes gene_type:complete